MVGCSALVLRDHHDGSKCDCMTGTPVTLSREEGLWKEQSHWDQNRRLEVSPLPPNMGMWGQVVGTLLPELEFGAWQGHPGCRRGPARSPWVTVIGCSEDTVALPWFFSLLLMKCS